jgi:hypothetical protein
VVFQDAHHAQHAASVVEHQVGVAARSDVNGTLRLATSSQPVRTARSALPARRDMATR